MTYSNSLDDDQQPGSIFTTSIRSKFIEPPLLLFGTNFVNRKHSQIQRTCFGKVALVSKNQKHWTKCAHSILVRVDTNRSKTTLGSISSCRKLYAIKMCGYAPPRHTTSGSTTPNAHLATTEYLPPLCEDPFITMNS